MTESRLGRKKTQIRIIGPLIHGDARSTTRCRRCAEAVLRRG
jgi:hypothetical protein